MNINKLKSVLESEYIKLEFLNEIRPEIEEYINRIKSNKDVKRVYVDTNQSDRFSDQNLITLLQLYEDDKILEWDLEYILGCIELGFEDVDEKAGEIIFNFSDPYLGYPIILENVKEAISFLGGEKDHFNMEENEGDSRLDYRSVLI